MKNSFQQLMKSTLEFQKTKSMHLTRLMPLELKMLLTDPQFSTSSSFSKINTTMTCLMHTGIMFIEGYVA